MRLTLGVSLAAETGESRDEESRLKAGCSQDWLPILAAPQSASGRVVAVAGLDDQILLLRGELKLTIHTARVAGLVRVIANAVLIAQLLFDFGVDLVDGLLVRHFIESSASLLR